MMKTVAVKKNTAQMPMQQARTDAARQPGPAMLRLLSDAELRVVSGGYSGPSRRGKGH